MMFIIRTEGERPGGEDFSIRLTRRTPAQVSGGTHDFFCEGDPDAARARGLNVVSVHDGWYADDTGGGVAVWGQGRFWEIRATPFIVRESSAGASPPPATPAAEGETVPGAGETVNVRGADETVNVRGAIFGV